MPQTTMSDWLDMFGATNAQQAILVEVSTQGAVHYISEPQYCRSADDTGLATFGFEEGFIELSSLSRQGAAGVPSNRGVVASFRVQNRQYRAGNIAEVLYGGPAIGGHCKIWVAATDGKSRGSPAGEWQLLPVFVGVVSEINVGEEDVEIIATTRSLSDMSMPTAKVQDEWFKDNGTVGQLPCGGEKITEAFGRVVPFGMGRCDITAVNDNWQAGSAVADGESNGRNAFAAIIPQMLGEKHPVVPLLAVWKFCDPFGGRNASDEPLSYAMRTECALFLHGDATAAVPPLKMETAPALYPHEDLLWPTGADRDAGLFETVCYRTRYSAVHTWYDGGYGPRALPIINDETQHGKYYTGLTGPAPSPGWTPTELWERRVFGHSTGSSAGVEVGFAKRRNYGHKHATSGAQPRGNWTNPGLNTNVFGQGTLLDIPMVVLVTRIDPNHPHPHTQTGMQAVAIGVTGLGTNHRLRFDRGITYKQEALRFDNVRGLTVDQLTLFSTKSVNNIENLLDMSLSKWASMKATEYARLALKLPVRFDALGQVVQTRLCWVNDDTAANTAHEVLIKVRQSPPKPWKNLRPDINTWGTDRLRENWSRAGDDPNDHIRDVSHPVIAIIPPNINDAHNAVTANVLLMNYDSRKLFGSVWLAGRDYGVEGRAKLNQDTNAAWKAWRESGYVGGSSWDFSCWGIADREEPVQAPWAPEVAFQLWFADDRTSDRRFWPSAVWKEVHFLGAWADDPDLNNFDDKQFDFNSYNVRGQRIGRRDVGRFLRGSLVGERKELPGLSVGQFFVGGRGPFDSAAKYTGASGSDQVIERGPDQLGYLLDFHAPQAFNDREAGVSAFGSFVDARTHIKAWTGPKLTQGSNPEHRLTTIVAQETTFGAIADRIAGQSMGFAQEQLKWDGLAQPKNVWRFFVDEPNMWTEQAERKYTTRTLTWEDIVEESLEATFTPLDETRNSFVLEYGYHLPTGTWAGMVHCNKNSNNLTSQGQQYQDWCALGFLLYNQEDRIDALQAPDIWNSTQAEALLRWHMANKVRRRVVVRFEGYFPLAALEAGNLIKLDDEIGDRVKYPGQFGTIDGFTGEWSTHELIVTEVDVTKDAGGVVRVAVTAVEGYSDPGA